MYGLLALVPHARWTLLLVHILAPTEMYRRRGVGTARVKARLLSWMIWVYQLVGLAEFKDGAACLYAGQYAEPSAG